jgi:hypothetical protein
MKKLMTIFYLLVCGTVLISAQSIDRSQYRPTTLEDYLFMRDTGEAVGKKYSFSVYYNGSASSGASMYFFDTLNFSGRKNFNGRISRRYTLEDKQLVTVYVTCESQFSSNIDDIVIGSSSQAQAKPWQPFISNGKSGLHGWYLQDMGNGTYKEVYFE